MSEAAEVKDYIVLVSFFSTKNTLPKEPLPMTLRILKLSLVICPFKNDFLRGLLLFSEPFGIFLEIPLPFC